MSLLGGTGVHRIDALFWNILFLVCGLGFVAANIPPPPLEPLVAREGWELKGGAFENSKPESADVDPEISGNWRSRFFRTWSPEAGAVPAEIRTSPFKAPKVLIVPFVGYAANLDISLDLVCVATDKKIRIATGNAHETWSQRVLAVSRGWCKGPVQVVAVSKSNQHYIGVGTPYKGSKWTLLKFSAPSFVFLHGWIFAMLIAPIIAIHLALKRPVRTPHWTIAVSLFGVVGYAQFFLVQWNRSLAAGLGLALYVWSLSVLTRAYIEQSRSGAGISVDWRIKLTYLFSLAMFLLLEMVDTGAGAWNAAYRFLPATWSSDHLLPRMVAEGLYALKPLPEIIGGSWQISDRPPLLSGIQLLLQPLVQPAAANAASASLYHYLPKILGIVAGAGLIAAITELVGILHRGAASPRYKALAVMLVVLSPFVIFNAIYTWPKLVTAFLALAGVLALRAAETPKIAQPVVAGTLFGLAMLCHAGVAFGLLGLPFVFRALYGTWGMVRIAAAGVVAIGLWVPWMLWQRFMDPPGNALVKFALAGTFGFAEKEKSVVDTVSGAYAALSFKSWLAMKGKALQNLVGSGYVDSDMKQFDMSWMSALRLHDFLFVAPSLRFLGIAILLGLVLMTLRKYRVKMAPLCLLLCAAFIGIALNVLLTWSSHINHHQSYFSIICLLLCAALMLLELPRRVGLALAALQLLYVMCIWGVEPVIRLGGVRESVAVSTVLVICFLYRELIRSLDGLQHSARAWQKTSITTATEIC